MKNYYLLCTQKPINNNFQMITGTLENAERIYPLHKGFKILFDFVANNDFDNLPLGKIEIQGDDVYVVNVKTVGTPADKQALEMHRKYIDVHIALADGESIGWKSRDELKNITKEYSESDDCAFSDDKPEYFVPLKKGEYAIVYPEDAHAPAVGDGEITKLIGKIRI